jgi:phosphoribosylaminoimidazole carboxylase PurE protein
MSDIADPNPPEIGTAELPDPEVELEQIEEEFGASGTLVGILVESEDVAEKLAPAERYLGEQGIDCELKVMSAHTEPDKVREYCGTARARGLKVIIAGAGMSAALPGLAAAHTDLPVIGVPLLGTSLGGLDALLSTVQMPAGIPVACVAIDGAQNAGMLAARIIGA